jgi:hypothetical protein
VNGLRLGIDTERVLVARLMTSGTTGVVSTVGRPDPSLQSRAIEARFLRLAERARAVPGVAAASVALSLPFYSSWATQLVLPGRDALPQIEDGGPYYNAVDEHFFTALGTRLVRGRGITAEDRRTRARVVVVNETMARLFWPGAEALGSCLRIGADTMPCSTVIGVAENSRRQGIIEGATLQYFVPLEVSPGVAPERVLFVRTAGSVGVLAAQLREVLQNAEANLPYVDVRPMRRLLDAELRPWVLGSTMFGAFGGVALVLAAVGVYGVFAYDVAQRAAELAVRMALGARSADVVRLVLRRALMIAVTGLVIGATFALIGGRWLRELLYEVSTGDPPVFGLVALVLVACVVAATILPAWRATRVDLRRAMSAE